MIPASLPPEMNVPPAAAAGPSFATALCGFIGTTLATTMLLVLIGTL